MSKEEIVIEFQNWVNQENFAADRTKYNDLMEKFNALRNASKEAQAKAQAEEGEESEITYAPDEHDQRFDELVKLYHEKRKEAEKSFKEAQSNSLSEKKALLKELDVLIKDEENIAKAYQRFNAIKQKWNELGTVGKDERREIQAEYSRLIEQFYYNIHIYQELQINDLKKNLELKKSVIVEIKLLENESSINQVDFLVHKYLDEWDEIGPTFKEEWDKIRDEFKESVGKVFDRIREHRKTIKSEHVENYTKKQELVTRLEEIAGTELEEVKQVQKLTKDVIDTQKEWKHLGFAGRGKNDKIWAEFRKACDVYFERRGEFLKKSNSAFDDVRKVKQKLIDRAKEIHGGENMGEIANQLKGLQREWKQSGTLLPQEEYKMFKEFRKFCDQFFNRRKESYKAEEKEHKQNLQKKEELVMGFKAQLDKGIEKEGEKVIDSWQQQWNSVGDVNRKFHDKLEKALDGLINQAYKKLGISLAEAAKKKFDNKLDSIANQSDAERTLMHERADIIQKIKGANISSLQLEDKLAFFKFSDDTNPLKKDLLDKIAKSEGEVQALKDRKKQIDLLIKDIRKAEAAAQEPEEEVVSDEESTEG
ncbi:MAG: DUF349 domain-containing protein [Bacteroidetes bacterium]|nr:DUF349 domain-containing protein [Bacteroidota bacterium]